ncbi:hypothetical protein VHEMI05393 [[Torrubiella] hemipterigena]|uniref:Uncharacterized protein n=1 Tax=[Torrubiella] hemipterigena TaxID=1531966 RepID=A0A0A1TIL8_9HYPO|nr:hypothetical protein VHEMI05393 [[Torrubiella] hemipterigena]
MSETIQLAGQEPIDFASMPWPELLRRFSEARFKVLQSQDGVNEDEEDEGQQDECPEKASDLLLPPLTAAEIAIAEAKLGPIPQDLKDMSLVARGFKGGWHFAGGGFPGLQDLFEGDFDAGTEYLEGLYDEDEGAGSDDNNEGDEGEDEDDKDETDTAEAGDKGENDAENDNEKPETVRAGVKRKLEYPSCWGYQGTVENDDVEHFICPPVTWAKFRKSQGKPKPKAGEYGIWCGSHWSIEPLDGLSLSMRGYIIRLLKETEEVLATRAARAGKTDEEGNDKGEGAGEEDEENEGDDDKKEIDDDDDAEKEVEE